MSEPMAGTVSTINNLFQNGAIVAQRAGAINGQTLRAWLQRHIRTLAAA